MLLDLLERMRSNGWTVAVHNDYMQNEQLKTFWLFTHAETGCFVKGESTTDEGAVLECCIDAGLAVD